jgi:inosine/xanthosine triphosphate pyrophosphatase family protein
MDETLQEPKLFESVVKGRLTNSPAGAMADYSWSRLFLVFVPDGREKTLAQMSREEYFSWLKSDGVGTEERELGEFLTSK